MGVAGEDGMRICDNCGVEKAESHFRKFGRGLKKLCKVVVNKSVSFLCSFWT